MTLPYDVARCPGEACPLKQSCLRYIDRNDCGERTPYAAFYIRRDIDSDYCAHIIPVITEKG